MLLIRMERLSFRLRRRVTAKRLAASAAALLLGFSALAAQGPASLNSASREEAKALLAPTGTLRAGFLATNPVQARVDEAGNVTGPVADLVEALATRLGVPFKMVPIPNVRGVIGQLQAKSIDFGFVAYDASRAMEIDYAGPFALMLSSYVVGNASSAQTSAEVDRAGTTVGAVKGVVQQLYISQNLSSAKVRIFDEQPSPEEFERLLTSGELAAFAMNRQRAIDLDAASPRLRALPDSFLDVPQEFIVLKGETEKRDYLSRFAAEMRSSGFMQAALARANLQDSTSVPSGTQR